MKILQTIYTALTNENELLVNINGIPCTFIEVYLYMLIFTTILKIDSTKKQKILFVVSFSIISLLNSWFGVMPFNNFINAIAMPILIFIIFRTNILKAILSEIINYALALLFGTIIMSLYTIIFNITSDAISIIPIHRLLFSVIYYILLFLLYKCFSKHNINFLLFDKLKNKNILLLVINFLIGSIAIGIEYYLLFNYIDVMPNSLVFLSLFVISLYFAISIFSLIRTSKLEETTQQLEIEKTYNKTLNTLYDNIRGFKHDFNNMIQAIGGYLSVNNINDLKTYYKELLEECQINNNLAVLNPELINNPAIYSLLADKYTKSESNNIDFNIEVMADLSNLNIKPLELTRILGILFDNALEAAGKCSKKIVNVTFKNDKSHIKTLIIIQNTYLNKDVDINKIFEKGYSSKEITENNKNHGLGLWEVRKYLSKHTELDLYTTKNDEFFTQQFEIYN